MSGDIKVRRVGIVSGTLGYAADGHLMSTREVLAAVGRNTGNLAFRFAVDRHIASPKIHVPWGSDPGWVREVCDLLVIPSSNQANPAADLSERAAFLEAVDLPCLAVGIGAQSPSRRDHVRLAPSTTRYLRSLSERGPAVGVRGDFTAEVLSYYGVRNTVVVGCPSHFINSSPMLGSQIAERIERGRFERLALTDIELVPSLRSVDRKLFQWLLRADGAYVCQSHPCVISLARSRMEEIAEDSVEAFHRHLLSPEEWKTRPPSWLVEEARRRFRVFFDVEAWLEFLTGFDLVVGVRFHGNLLAMQAGTPGVCVVHDARTEELCETTALPHVRPEQVLAAKSVEDLVEAATFDAVAFDARRRDLANTYWRLLSSCGVESSEALRRLANEEASTGEPAARALVGTT
jgi:hypothetical protein